jgi:hypothetical protein
MAFLPIQLSTKFVKRFWAKVALGKPDDCWFWTGAVGSNGRGRMGWPGGKTVEAHRIAWLLVKGPIPDGLSVLHDCPRGDNLLCCNPRHLWVGTQAQNMADMARKGRARRGEKHAQAKLTASLVTSIRNDNRLHREIAADLGVSPSLISMVKSREIWRHV